MTDSVEKRQSEVLSRVSIFLLGWGYLSCGSLRQADVLLHLHMISHMFRLGLCVCRAKVSLGNDLVFCLSELKTLVITIVIPSYIRYTHHMLFEVPCKNLSESPEEDLHFASEYSSDKLFRFYFSGKIFWKCRFPSESSAMRKVTDAARRSQMAKRCRWCRVLNVDVDTKNGKASLASTGKAHPTTGITTLSILLAAGWLDFIRST